MMRFIIIRKYSLKTAPTVKVCIVPISLKTAPTEGCTTRLSNCLFHIKNSAHRSLQGSAVINIFNIGCLASGFSSHTTFFTPTCGRTLSFRWTGIVWSSEGSISGTMTAGHAVDSMPGFEQYRCSRLGTAPPFFPKYMFSHLPLMLLRSPADMTLRRLAASAQDCFFLLKSRRCNNPSWCPRTIRYWSCDTHWLNPFRTSAAPFKVPPSRATTTSSSPANPAKVCLNNDQAVLWNLSRSGILRIHQGICANTSRVSVEKEIQVNFIDINLWLHNQYCMATNLYRWSNITYQNIQVHIWYGTFSYSVSNSDDSNTKQFDVYTKYVHMYFYTQSEWNHTNT